MPKAHSNLGTLLNEAGRVEEAVNSLTTAIGLNPELPEAHFNLGAALAKSGRQIEAEKSFGRAIALRPGYTKAQLDLAQLQLQMGRLDAAASTARIVLETRPGLLESALPARKHSGRAESTRGSHRLLSKGAGVESQLRRSAWKSGCGFKGEWPNWMTRLLRAEKRSA